MRIVLISFSFCEYVIQLANAISSRGDELLIILPMQLVNSTVKQELKNIKRPEVNCTLMDLTGRKTFAHYTSILSEVRAFKPDLIHIQENGELETLFIIQMLRMPRIALTIHDVITHPGADSTISLRRKAIKQYIRKRAHRIHVHNTYSKNLLRTLSIDMYDRSTVIPHGTLSAFKHWEKVKIEKEPSTCLFFGRMEKYRGLDTIVNQADTLQQMIPGIKIVVAGRGTELQKYRNALMNNKIFELHDEFIPDEDIYKYFRRSSVVLLPYKEASQSGVLSMALAFEVPVIATDVGSISEYIRNNCHGLIVKSSNPRDFCHSIKYLLDNDNIREEMILQCRKLAEEYDFENLADKYRYFYSTVIRD